MEGQSNEDVNKKWFNFYVNEFEKSPSDGFKKFEQYFLCPCCQFPTLSQRKDFDICPLCDWEDDGQDDHNANIVLGGPNQSYSLTEARENFQKYLTSYRPSDKYHFERTTVKKTIDGEIIWDLTVMKKEIMEKYITAMSVSNTTERKKTLSEIRKLIKKLLDCFLY